MKFCKKTLSFILAFMLMFSTFNPLLAMSDTGTRKTTIKGQELVIGDKVYYIFSTDRNAKSDLIKAQEKGELQLEKLQASDGLDISGALHQDSVGSGESKSYTIHIKGSNFIGVGGKSFDWATLPNGLEVQLVYIDYDGNDISIGNPIIINESNYKNDITRTHEISGDFIAFAMKTNLDAETYLTDVYQTRVNSPSPWDEVLNMTFDLIQVPSTKLDIKWVDVNKQPLARENTPATVLKDILTFNFIENRKFDLPNQDKEDSYFRLINKIERRDIKDMEGATALVAGKKNGEEVTLDGKIYKLTTRYNPAFNEGSKIQLMYMPDVIDRTNNPDATTPDKYVRVTIDAGEGTKLAQGQTKKVYDVRIGKVLKAEHYPKLEISDSAKYKDPITWTIAPGTAITKAENILGKAEKTAAETITKENLKAADTTILQGKDFPEKFWNDGVVLADNVDAAKKAEFEALLAEATVTDKSSRTTAKDGTFEGKLLVTFKDGSTLEVPNQKLIVKPNTVKVELDKDAQGNEKPLRDGDTTVKGKISASSSSDEFPVSLDGAVVTIKKGAEVLSRTLAKADGSFVAGVKDPLHAGEDISVVVTLPESKTESAPVTEKVQLNPDKLNEIIPTGEELVKNLKGKKGVDQAKVATLEAAIKKAYKDLVDEAPKGQKQKDQKVKSTVTVNEEGQKSLDDQYKAIKKAIEELTGNHAPEVKGTTSHKEIFKGDDLDLEKGITVTDKDGENDIALQGDKKFTYTVEKIGDKGAKEVVEDTATINQTPGTYEVTYTAKDKSGAEGKFVMTLVVKKTVIEVPGEFPEETPDGYVKVEFKEGDHGKLEGTTKFLVKDGSAKTVLNAPTIKPNANYEATKDANWKPVLPETFTGTEENKKSFTFTAQYTYTGSDVVPQKPGDEKPDVPKDFVKVEFKKGDHGVISSEYTTIYWVNPDAGKTLKDITKPKEATAFEGYKFTGWDKADTEAIGKAGLTVTAQYKAKVVTKDPNDPEHYAKVEFLAGDQGKFEQVGGKDQVTTIWVLKKEEVKFNAPTVTPNNGFVFSGWEPELLTKYTEDKTHTAKYEPKSDISDVPVAGFQEVKFLAGTDGNFGTDNETPITTKSVWVRPGVKVDLTSKAPKVTVTNNQKGFVGWDKPLVGTFNLEKDESEQPKATEIKAVYKDKVVTTDPKDKKHYAEVEFLADDAAHTAEPRGTFEKQGEKEQTTKFWVLKNEEVTFNAPQVTAKKGYTFDKWDPEVKTSYDKDQTHTATYKTNSSISDDPVEGFQEVKFLPGTDGKFEGEKQVKSVWVEPGVLVDLRTKAPKVTANEGKVHTGWDRDLVGTFKLETENGQPKATEITAQYKDKVVTKDPKDKNYVTVEFLAGAHGKFEQVGDPKKDQTTKFWVYKNEKVTFNAPTVTADEGYSFTVWKEPIKTVYSENTTHTAQYSNTISDKYVEGWTEITFNSGDHGRFVADAKTVKWVDPKADIKLSDMAPGITPDTNYSFKAWNNGTEDVAENTVAIYTKATTFTATYESDISETEKTGFVKVTFAPGTDGKFISGKTTTHVRKNKDVDLREKAPKVMPKTGYGHTGWDHDLAKVNVKEDTTITATYTKGEFDAKNITSFDILGPKKAAYAEGDTLDLTGFTVVAIDKAGIRKEYTVQGDKLKNGEEELTGVTLKVGETAINLADLPKLNNKAHDDKPITLTKGDITKDSKVHLTVSMTKTSQPTDLVAANQGENPTETKIKGKAKKGDTVKIYVPGNDKPIKEVVVTNEDGTFETSVSKENKPYDVGTKFNVTATAVDKEESSPQEVKVIKDVNGDWKDDGEDQRTKTPTAEALNQGSEPKVTTITGKAEPGAKVVAKVGDVKVGEATADPQTGEYKIEAKKDGAALPKDTDVKVTAQVEGKLESEPATTKVKVDKDGNGTADNEEDFDIKKVTKVEVLQDPTKMDYLVASKTAKTPFKTAGLVIKLTDSTGKEVKYTADELKNMDGIKIEPANDEEIGLDKNNTKLKVTVTGSDLTEKPTAESKKNITVKIDADGNGIADEDEKTPEPEVYARNIGKDPKVTTVEVETEKNADVTIEYKDANGETKTITGKADDQGKLTKEITPKLDKDTPVKVTVKDGEKKPTDKTVKVFEDLDDNKIPDTQAGQTERPAALASNIGKDPRFTTITGEAEKGATVTAYVGTEVVGTATADKTTGKYTIQAKQNNAPIKEGVKVDVTAILAPKTESLKQTVVVFNDTDGTGQPDSAKDFDPKKAIGMQVVASPDKMVYTDGDKLNLDGLKVLLTDVNGNQKIFTYKHADNTEFTKAGLSVDLKQDTELSSKDYNAQTAKDGHNGRKLVVTLDTTGNTQVTEAITGETPTALTVNKKQSAKPTDLAAANQGDAKVTRVKGKAVSGAEIKVTDKAGNNLLPDNTTVKADSNGDFTADLNKLLDPGTKVYFTATEPGKTESLKEEETVIRDKDGNWKADTGSKLSTPVIDPIREKDEKVVVAAPKADDKIQTIEVSDQNGKTVTLTKDATGNTWTVVGSDPAVKVTEEGGKIAIPVKDKLPLNDRDQIKVTFKDGEKPTPNEAFDRAPVQKASQTPTVDQVYTGDKSVKIVDPTVADPTAKTIKVKAGDNDSMTVEKQADGSWKVKEDPNKEVKVEDGKIVVPLDPSAKKDEIIKVSTINDSGKASPAKEVKVVDREKSKKPELNQVTSNDNKITGKNAKPGADIVITITPKDGGEPKKINAKADENGNFEVDVNNLKDGDKIVATAKEKDKDPAESDPVTVGIDTSELDKAIQDGKDALDPKKGGKNNGTPEDKALEKAIKEGEEVSKNPESAEKVKEKKEAIEKAIKDKKDADEARDKLQEKINEANDKKNDPEYPTKPDDVRKELDKAATDGQVTHDDKTKKKEDIDKEIEKIQEKIDQYNKQQLAVSITPPVAGTLKMELTTIPGNSKFKVYKGIVSEKNLIGEGTTNSKGIGTITFDENTVKLKSGMILRVVVEHDGYLSRTERVKVI